MKSLIVIMGVCGSGKSTIAEAITQSLPAVFLEGDDYHTPENILKMSQGNPLVNEDRAGWVDAMATAIQHSNEFLLVLSCSALNSFVRERLANGCGRPIKWIYLKTSRKELVRRMRARKNHFMKETMIDSQLSAMDPPNEAYTIDGDQCIKAILEDILRVLNNEA